MRYCWKTIVLGSWGALHSKIWTRNCLLLSLCLVTLLVPCAGRCDEVAGMDVTNVFSETFDSAGGWTLEGHWQVGTPLVGPDYDATRSCAGTRLDGFYDGSSSSMLVSPSISLPPTNQPRQSLSLYFSMWSETESSLDSASLWITTDGGANWRTLRQLGDTEWNRTSVNLTAYQGVSVQLAFILRSDEFAERAGCYIDDICVQLETPKSLSAIISDVNSMNPPYVYASVAVFTNGVAAGGLDRSNFSIFEDGVAQTNGVAVTKPGESGGDRLVDIVFIVDNSGSMGSEHDAIETNVLEFVDGLSAAGVNFALGLCRYGQGENGGQPIIEDEGALTSDAQYFKNVLWQRNEVSGGTEPGYKSIIESVTKMQFRPGARRAFIIITDETPEQGPTTLAEAKQSAIAGQVTLFALTRVSLFPAFEPITDATGGKCFDIVSDFDEILDAISEFLSNSYIVRYRSTNPAPDGRTRELRIELNYGGFIADAIRLFSPRSSPRIERTDTTLALHNAPFSVGDELTIEARITDFVEPHTQNAKLYYRTTGSTGVYESVAMAYVEGSLWRGVVASGYLSHPGVDYYLTASDGESTVSDPSYLPISNAYQFAVAPNVAPAITHTTVSSPTPGQPLPITADITDDTAALSWARVYYRSAGQLLYQEALMTPGVLPEYGAVIPGTYVVEDGLDYYLLAEDDQGVARYDGTPDAPHRTAYPDIAVTPHSFSNVLETGGITTELLTITSVSGGEGALIFEVAPGNQAPAGVLSFEPQGAFIMVPGGSTGVVVTIDASGLSAGNYPLEIIVSANDADQPHTTISGTLTVVAAPDLSLSRTSLAFGNVMVGLTSSNELSLINSGFAPLDIYSITPSVPNVSLPFSPITLAPGESNSIMVTYAPLAAGSMTGQLAIISSDPDQPTLNVPLDGAAMPLPHLASSPISIVTNMAPDTTASTQILIENTLGQSDLYFELECSTSNRVLHASDSFGYTWTDSDDPDGQVFEWVDISEMGTELALNNGYAGVSLEHPIFLYGRHQSYISVYPQMVYCGSTYISTGLGGLVDGQCFVFYDSARDRTILQYSNWQQQNGSGSYAFQVHLCGSGHVYLYYETVVNPPAGNTISISGNGNSLLVSNESETYLYDELAVCFAPPLEICRSATQVGIIPAGQSQVVALQFNATNLNAGVYVGNISISSDDPLNPTSVIPFTVEVSGVPQIATITPPYDFGECYVGYAYTTTVSIANTGTDDLNISAIRATASEISLSPSSAVLAPGAALHMPVIYTPSSDGSQPGNIEVDSDDPGNSLVVHTLSATTAYPPVLSTSTTPIEYVLGQGSIREFSIPIENLANNGELRWNIMLQQPAGSIDTNALSDAYYWIDSDSANGPVYQWQDISSLGVPTGLAGDDSSVELSLGFDFPFYGQTYDKIRLSSNGYLTFETYGSSTSANGPCPNPSSPNNLIAFFWRDLHQRSGSSYHYHDAARNRWIVQYSNWGSFSGTGDYTCQVHLYSNGEIMFYYESMTGSLDNGTIGIEGAAGTNGISIAYSEPYIHDQLAVTIRSMIPSIEADFQSGTLAAGGSTQIVFTIDAAELEVGDYSGYVIISSNDPVVREVRIPVTLHVTAYELQLKTIPYQESFETYGIGTAPRAADGWYHVEGGVSISADENALYMLTNVYQQAGGNYPIATNHTKVLQLQGLGTTTNAIHGTGAQGHDIYTEFLVLPIRSNQGEFHAVSLAWDFAIVFDESGNTVVALRETPQSTNAVWHVLSAVPQVGTNEWVRVTLKQIYSRDINHFQIHINGGGAVVDGTVGYTPVGAVGGSWFIMPDQTGKFMSDINFAGGGMVDDITIGVEHPFPTLQAQNTPRDWLEVHYPGAADYDALVWTDLDGDGQFVWQEFRAGTDPNVATSVFAAAVSTSNVTNGFTLHWPSAPGRFYSITQTTNLMMSFQPVVENLPATPPVNHYTDQSGASQRRYFRISLDQ